MASILLKAGNIFKGVGKMFFTGMKGMKGI